MSAFGETLTVHTRAVTGQDADGNDVYGDVPASSSGWSVFPRNSSEVVQGQATVIVGVTAVGLGTVSVAAADRVSITTGPYAATYEVDGLPGFYVNPQTGTQVTELHLKRVTG